MSLATAVEPSARAPEIEPQSEFLKCASNCAYFVHNYGVIDDTQNEGENSGTMRFRLWPAQVRVLWTLTTERLVIILKARQLGISWAVCAFVLWLCLFTDGQTVLLISKGQKEANELLRRIKALYHRLPDWLKAMLPAISDRDNAHEFDWVNNSRILSLPATRNAGISFTASLVVMDEAAHMRFGEELYLNVKPTIDQGGRLIILSTANGMGGFFHSIWTKAIAGLNAFTTVFLPWWVRPGRTAAWFRRVSAEATDPKLIPQNYPANALEAFLATGSTRFAPEWVSRQASHLAPAIPAAQWPKAMFWQPGWPGIDRDRDWLMPLAAVPGLHVYQTPTQTGRYLIAADVAEGTEKGDFDAAVVIDRDTREEMATLHGRWEPDEFARYLAALSEPYQAPVIVERNNHGHAVLATFKLKYFPRVADGLDRVPGWHTNQVTKPEGIDHLAECLRDRLVTIRHPATLVEMQYYSRLRGGKFGAPPGYHDDLVMAWVVGLSWLRHEKLASRWGEASRGRSPLAGYRG